MIRVLDPAPSSAILAAGKANLAAAFPFFANMQVVQSWGGLIDATPDALPVISAVLTPHNFHEHETHQEFFAEHLRTTVACRPSR